MTWNSLTYSYSQIQLVDCCLNTDMTMEGLIVFLSLCLSLFLSLYIYEILDKCLKKFLSLFEADKVQLFCCLCCTFCCKCHKYTWSRRKKVKRMFSIFRFYGCFSPFKVNNNMNEMLTWINNQRKTNLDPLLWHCLSHTKDELCRHICESFISTMLTTLKLNLLN